MFIMTIINTIHDDLALEIVSKVAEEEGCEYEIHIVDHYFPLFGNVLGAGSDVIGQVGGIAGITFQEKKKILICATTIRNAFDKIYGVKILGKVINFFYKKDDALKKAIAANVRHEIRHSKQFTWLEEHGLLQKAIDCENKRVYGIGPMELDAYRYQKKGVNGKYQKSFEEVFKGIL